MPLIVAAGPFGAAFVLSLLPPVLELLPMLRGGTGSFWLVVKSVSAMLAGYLACAVEALSLAAIELAKRLDGYGTGT